MTCSLVRCQARSNDVYSYSSDPPPRQDTRSPPSPSNPPTISFGSPNDNNNNTNPYSQLEPPNGLRNDSTSALSHNPSSRYASSPSATAGHPSPSFPANNGFPGPSALGNGQEMTYGSPSTAGSVYTNGGASSPVQGPGDDEDLMLSLMAGQASVDVGIEGYRIMGWEEVEDSKKVSSSGSCEYEHVDRRS